MQRGTNRKIRMTWYTTSEEVSLLITGWVSFYIYMMYTHTHKVETIYILPISFFLLCYRTCIEDTIFSNLIESIINYFAVSPQPRPQYNTSQRDPRGLVITATTLVQATLTLVLGPWLSCFPSLPVHSILQPTAWLVFTTDRCGHIIAPINTLESAPRSRLTWPLMRFGLPTPL